MLRQNEIKLVDTTIAANFVLPNGKEVPLTSDGIELFNTAPSKQHIAALVEQVIRQLEV